MRQTLLVQRSMLLFCMLMAGMWLSQAAPAVAETLYLVSPHGGIRKIDSEDPKWHAKALADKQLSVNNITFNITYDDVNSGFNDAALGAQRRARLEDALTYVASVLNIQQARTLDVQVEQSEFDAGGFLAQAGTFFSLASGFQNGTAFQRLATGNKPFSNPEIFVTVDFGFNWNISTAAPTAQQFDLISVLTHEITHGLGILSLAGSNGVGVLGGAPNTYTVWDALIIRNNGLLRLWSGNPPSFKGVLNDLTSNSLFFDGLDAFNRYNQGVRAGIYAPSPFSSGSSLSHWDTGNIVGEAVMEHSIGLGEQKRTYAPVEIGALRDLGYTNAADPVGGFTLTTNFQGNGTVTRNPNLGTYTAGTVVTVTAVPGPGAQFQNWTGPVANPNSATTTVTMSQNQVVTAVFTQVQPTFTLTTNVQGNGAVTRNPNAASYLSGTVVTLTAVPGPGSQFVNWTGPVANANSATTTVTMSQNQVVTAVFTQVLPTFTLTTNVSGNGTVQRDPNAANYTSGTVVTLTALPGVGAQFSNWTGPVANPNSATTTVTMSQNQVVTAVFTALTPAQISVNPNGTVNFGSVEAGSTAEQVFTVSNTGGLQLSGQASVNDSSNTFFVSLGASYNIAGGANAPVRIAFNPAEPGEFSAVATFTGGQNGPITVALTGTATKPAGAGCAPGTGSSADPMGDALVVGLVLAGLAWASRKRLVLPQG
jgi:hypothetical protein